MIERLGVYACLNINMDVKCLLGCKSFSDLVIE